MEDAGNQSAPQYATVLCFAAARCSCADLFTIIRKHGHVLDGVRRRLHQLFSVWEADGLGLVDHPGIVMAWHAMYDIIVTFCATHVWYHNVNYHGLTVVRITVP